MSEKPISPLRRRMIEDMTVRHFVEKTQNDYIRHVRTFTTFLGRAPDTAAPEDLRLFQLHQTQAGVGASGINGSVAALRFFFTVTLDRPEMARHLTFVREPRKIPVILSLEEIARLLEAAPGPKYKAALSAAYGAGLRVSEVVALKVSDIDSERMLLHIEQGKGRKDRFAMLSPRLLELLRDWYRIARPAGRRAWCCWTCSRLFRAKERCWDCRQKARAARAIPRRLGVTEAPDAPGAFSCVRPECATQRNFHPGSPVRSTCRRAAQSFEETSGLPASMQVSSAARRCNTLTSARTLAALKAASLCDAAALQWLVKRP
jgi:integrase